MVMTKTIEEKSLQEHEKIVQRGLDGFREAGESLMEIKSKQLYKGIYGTFEVYCRKRWKLSTQQAGRLIKAARVVDSMRIEPNGSVLPNKEAQVRVLAKSANPSRTWANTQESTGTEQPTAREIAQVIEDEIAGEDDVATAVDDAKLPFQPRAVRQIFDDGDIFYYDSITQASKVTGAQGTHISKVASGKRQKARGTRWEYM